VLRLYTLTGFGEKVTMAASLCNVCVLCVSVVCLLGINPSRFASKVGMALGSGQ